MTQKAAELIDSLVATIRKLTSEAPERLST
mgnify:FL=1